MTLRTMTLSVESTDTGLGFSFDAQGEDVQAEEVANALLIAAERILIQTIRSEFEAQNPLGNREFQSQQARLEGRLLMMDLVCHLPDAEGEGLISRIE